MEAVGLLYEFFTAASQGAEDAKNKIRELDDVVKELTKDTGNMNEANKELLKNLAKLDKFKGTDIEENFGERVEDPKDELGEPLSLFDVQNGQQLEDVTKAIKANVEEISKEAKKVNDLFEDGDDAISQEDVDSVNARLKSAKAMLDLAQSEGQTILGNNVLNANLLKVREDILAINKENVKALQETTELLSKAENADVKVLFDLADAEQRLKDKLDEITEQIQIQKIQAGNVELTGVDTGIDRLEAALFLEADNSQALDEINDIFDNWTNITLSLIHI